MFNRPLKIPLNRQHLPIVAMAHSVVGTSRDRLFEAFPSRDEILFLYIYFPQIIPGHPGLRIFFGRIFPQRFHILEATRLNVCQPAQYQQQHTHHHRSHSRRFGSFRTFPAHTFGRCVYQPYAHNYKVDTPQIREVIRHK